MNCLNYFEKNISDYSIDMRQRLGGVLGAAGGAVARTVAAGARAFGPDVNNFIPESKSGGRATTSTAKRNISHLRQEHQILVRKYGFNVANEDRRTNLYKNALERAGGNKNKKNVGRAWRLARVDPRKYGVPKKKDRVNAKSNTTFESASSWQDVNPANLNSSHVNLLRRTRSLSNLRGVQGLVEPKRSASVNHQRSRTSTQAIKTLNYRKELTSVDLPLERFDKQRILAEFQNVLRKVGIALENFKDLGKKAKRTIYEKFVDHSIHELEKFIQEVDAQYNEWYDKAITYPETKERVVILPNYPLRLFNPRKVKNLHYTNNTTLLHAHPDIQRTFNTMGQTYASAKRALSGNKKTQATLRRKAPSLRQILSKVNPRKFPKFFTGMITRGL